MSTLFLASGPIPLAERLADLLDRQTREDDSFEPIQIVVPNPYMGQWLRLWLARRHSIAVNLRIGYLEQLLWDLLGKIDTRPHAQPPEMLDGETYRLLVLAVLLGESSPDLAPLRSYFSSDSTVPSSRRSWRRAWHLAEVLGNLIRDYEYHRQEELIQPWIKNKLKLADSPFANLETAQRAVFDHIIDEKHGKRTLLSEGTGRNLKTLPQYAMELLEIRSQESGVRSQESQARMPKTSDESLLSPDSCFLTARSPVHLFGLTQISALHVHTLRWLGQHFDFCFYHANPLVSRLSGEATTDTISKVARAFAPPPGAEPPALDNSPANALLRPWGRAAAESLWLLGDLVKVATAAPRMALPTACFAAPGFGVEILHPKAKQLKTSEPTVLEGLQAHLLGNGSKTRLLQDRSLQIVGCPGARREVEVVFQSILQNLDEDRGLGLEDLAVLVTDMAKYRPLLQGVFERSGRPIAYSLLDGTAAETSVFGKAILGIIDLALESFTRTRVFEVLLNPCFRARLGADRTATLTWSRWAKELGIYQGWDAQDRKERGYAESPRYGFDLGLKRLRLGRYMEADSGVGGPAARFGDIMPFADMDSQDREQLDAFSRAVEGLLPTLLKLRGKHAKGKAWADTLRYLIQTFLAIPEDRPEETQVRDALLGDLERLASWDHLDALSPLPLAVVREFVHDNLQILSGRRGDYAAGGVTIAALATPRPIPFAIVYVLGLGEDNFPGRNMLSSLDLRGYARRPGDIWPAERARFLFLETLLAAQRKIYLLYNNKDIQKDQDLLPAVPLVQLQRFLKENVLAEEYKPVTIPLHDHDSLPKDTPPETYDAGLRVSEVDRLLALGRAKEAKEIVLDNKQDRDYSQRLARRLPDFALPKSEVDSAAVTTITIRDLADFLKNPGLASLKRHLHVRDEDDDGEPADDEPFVSPKAAARRIRRQVLQAFILESVKGSLAKANALWPDQFRQFYEDEAMRCRAPERGFGAADRAFLHAEIDAQIQNSLTRFLAEHYSGDFCGPVLLGESFTPIGAKLRFPALTVKLPALPPEREARSIRICGSTAWAWADGKYVDLLVLTSKAKGDKKSALCDYLFEPLLLYLAVRANPEAGQASDMAQRWATSARLRVHVCYQESADPFEFAFSSTQAAAYLSALVAEYLDPAAFDLLPFDVLAKKEQLCAAFLLEDGALEMSAADYRDLLKDEIDSDSESFFGAYWQTPLVDLARLEVPQHALDIVRRRFRLFHTCRQDAPPPKTRKKS